MSEPCAAVCDLAVWDVAGDLTEVLRRRLQRPTRQVGATIAIDSGTLGERRVAVARPRRLTASQLPSVAEGLSAVVAAHDPRRLAIVGIAAAREGELEVGAIVPWDEAGVQHTLSADWDRQARRAAEATGQPFSVLAVVTRNGVRRGSRCRRHRRAGQLERAKRAAG